MADAKALPVFCFVDDFVQVEDLRKYLNSKGAKLDPKGPSDLSDNLLEIVQNTAIVGGVGPEADAILSSISSLFVAIPEDKAENVVSSFCDVITPEHFKGLGWGSAAGAAIRMLSNLFRGFTHHAKIQERLFIALLDMCREARLISEMDVSQNTLSDYFKTWQTDVVGRRSILRKLHMALLADNRADQAAKVMIALLDLYTDEDADSAIEDAQECVRTAVVDPKSFSFDHILRLSAVKQLEKKDPSMHQALKLFASGTFKDYQSFVKAEPKFVADKLHVDETILVKKIRLLTLMSIAEKNQLVPLSLLSSELDITDDEELEEFVIEAVQVNAISGKLNEKDRTLHVSSFQHRSFGRDEWVTLQARLRSLISSVKNSHENIKKVNEITLVN